MLKKTQRNNINSEVGGTVKANLAVGAQLDAANRLRVSQITTLGDYKQTHDDLALYFDQEGTGSGVYSQQLGGVQMSVTAGQYLVRQTFQRHPYQSGKSHLIEATFSDMQLQAGVVKRVGYYTSSIAAPFSTGYDGMFFESDGDNDYSVNVYKYGVSVAKISRKNWDDRMDGSGESGITMNFSKFNVLVIDFLYLGGTSVRFGFLLDGAIRWFAIYNNAGKFGETMIGTPNQPVRYEIRSTTGSGNMVQICAQVATEGALNIIGNDVAIDSLLGGTGVINANTVGVEYMVAAFRLKSTHFDVASSLVSFSLLPASQNDPYLVRIRTNPTIANEPAWTGIPNTAFEYILGDQVNATSNTTVTGGERLYSQLGAANADLIGSFENSRKIGASINGTPETVVLSVIPLSSNLDIRGTFTIREQA